MARNTLYTQAAKIRKQAEREIKKLDKKRKTLSGAERKQVTKQIREIRQLSKQTYRGSGYDIQKSMNKLLYRYNIGTKTREMDLRANRMFQQQIALAQRGSFSELGKNGKLKVQAFYRATQRWWENVDPQNRNNAIMAKLGVSNMREAYEKVMQNPNVQNALHQAISNWQPIGITDENAGFYADIDNTPYEVLMSMITVLR